MKKALSVLLSLLLVFGTVAFSLTAAAEEPTVVAQGYCGGEGDGTNLTWVLTNDGTLTISGEGAMADYTTPWYSWRNDVQTVVIEDGVTFIEDRAFDGCTSLTSVTIGNNVTVIDDYAFAECTSLESITIPDSVTDIGEWAFFNCTLLKDLTIGNGVTILYCNAFENCTSLESVVLPDGISTISVAFIGCTSLKSVTMPASMMWVDYAFSGCTSLKDVYYKGSEEQWAQILGKESGNDPLLNATIHYNVVDWGYCGAAGNEENVMWVLDTDGTLTISGEGEMEQYYSSYDVPWHDNYRNDILTAIIEDGVKSISSFSFFQCENLETVTISDSVLSLGYSLFGGCQSLTSITFSNSIDSIESTDLENTPWFAAQPDGMLYIGKVAFRYKGDLPENASLVLREDCVEIGPQAFNDCSNLTSISLPDGVERIKYHAFGNCASLEEIVLPANLKIIYSFVFSGCSSLTHLTIPDSVTAIYSNAFENCTGLISVENLDSVDEIFQEAFKNCTSLTSASIPEGQQTIWSGTFKGCTALKDVTIPESVTSIFSSAFMNCSSLESILLPDTIERIERSAFENCSSLKSITLPKSLTLYGQDYSAFKGCNALSSITVAPGNTKFYSVDNCVIGGKTLVLACKTSVIPNDGSVTKIGSYAFASAPETILIPSFIQTFGKCIFADCTDLKTAVFEPGITTTPEDCLPRSVTKIVIPDTVTKIDAFLCRNFSGVYGPVPQNSAGSLEIYYTGSEEQWNQIEIENWAETYPNNNILAATKHFDYQFQTVPATEATETAHGYTEGVYCDVADLYISGHEVIHNMLGARYPVEEAPGFDPDDLIAYSEEGDYIIYCSVCNEPGLYKLEAGTPTDPTDPNNNGGNFFTRFVDGVRAAVNGFISWFLRLIKWLK